MLFIYLFFVVSSLLVVWFSVPAKGSSFRPCFLLMICSFPRPSSSYCPVVTILPAARVVNKSLRVLADCGVSFFISALACDLTTAGHHACQIKEVEMICAASVHLSSVHYDDGTDRQSNELQPTFFVCYCCVLNADSFCCNRLLYFDDCT